MRPDELISSLETYEKKSKKTFQMVRKELE